MSYHLRRHDRAIADRQAMQRIIQQNRCAVMALCRDNEPYIVTLDYGYDAAENALYFHCAKEGKKINFIKANPAACATVIDDDDPDSILCDHEHRSVVLSGTVELVDSREETDRAINLMIEQLEKGNPERFRKKLNMNEKSYVNLQILKMTVKEMTGKERVY